MPDKETNNSATDKNTEKKLSAAERQKIKDYIRETAGAQLLALAEASRDAGNIDDEITSFLRTANPSKIEDIKEAILLEAVDDQVKQKACDSWNAAMASLRCAIESFDLKFEPEVDQNCKVGEFPEGFKIIKELLKEAEQVGEINKNSVSSNSSSLSPTQIANNSSAKTSSYLS